MWTITYPLFSYIWALFGKFDEILEKFSNKEIISVQQSTHNRSIFTQVEVNVLTKVYFFVKVKVLPENFT